MSAHIDQHVNVKELQALADILSAEHSHILPSVAIEKGELTVRCRRTDILEFLRFLRDNKQMQFRCLMDICAVDWLGREAEREDKRFDVVYHLLSLSYNIRIRVKIFVADSDTVPSAVDVFDGANWYEREAFDLFGIRFENHPDLRRILTDYDFDGFPLRKDFPLEGKVEAYYDEKEGRVAYKPVDLPQERREFNHVSPWEGMDNNAHLSCEDAVFDTAEFEEEEVK